MHQTAIPVIDTLIAAVYVVHLEATDMLVFVTAAGTHHDRRGCRILPSYMRKEVRLIDTLHGLFVEIHVGRVVGMYLPGLIAGPRIIVRPVRLKGIGWRDKHVDTILQGVTDTRHLDNLLCRHRSLRL